MQTIGIYSGTFDPIHNGHVQFALDALRHANLQKVYFLVEPDPRHKQGVKALEHRYEMVRLAIRPHPELAMVLLDHQRFTVHQTLPSLQRRFHGLSLAMLMGSDVFMRLPLWPHANQLVANVSFVVGARQGKLSSLAATPELVGGHQLHYTVFESSLPSVASTAIRRSLRHGVIPPGLDPVVADYIQLNELYAPEHSAPLF